MGTNAELSTLWTNIADAIREKDGTTGDISPSTYPQRILGIELLKDCGQYPIYVSGPAGSSVSAALVGGEVANGSIGDDGNGVIWVASPGVYTVTGTTSSGTALSSKQVTISDDVTCSISLSPQRIDSVSPLKYARTSLAAASVGDYALFGGGITTDATYTPAVDAYNTTLTRSTPNPLSASVYGHTGASSDTYAFFAGGYNASSGYSSNLDTYNTSLTRTNTATLSKARKDLAAATIGRYTLFGGGFARVNSTPTYYDRVDVYDEALTRSGTTLSLARNRSAAATIGDYALFGGGLSPDICDTVDVYDTSLTRSTAAGLSEARHSLAAATIGNYAIFAGGSITAGQDYTDAVDIYDTSLTKTTITPLSEVRSKLAAASIGGYALFGGGDNRPTATATNEDTWVGSDIVDTYNTSLTKGTATSLSSSRGELAATTVGDYALFAGGDRYEGSTRSDTYFATVDAYHVA